MGGWGKNRENRKIDLNNEICVWEWENKGNGKMR